MSAVGGISGAGVAPGGGGSGGVPAVSGTSPSAAPENATQGTQSPQEVGSSEDNKTACCSNPIPGMSTQNFVSLQNSVNVNNSVDGVSQTDQIEFNLKKLLELLIAIKLMEALSSDKQGAGVGASLNITA